MLKIASQFRLIALFQRDNGAEKQLLDTRILFGARLLFQLVRRQTHSDWYSWTAAVARLRVTSDSVRKSPNRDKADSSDSV